MIFTIFDRDFRIVLTSSAHMVSVGKGAQENVTKLSYLGLGNLRTVMQTWLIEQQQK